MAGEAPLIYKNTNGDKMTVASGGILDIATGGKLQNNGVDLDLSAGIATATAATTAELDRAADVSTRLVAAGATEAITVLAHDGRITALDTAAGSICTLPSATGTGGIFRFVVTVKPTSNAHIVKVTTTDVMYGLAIGSDDDGVPANAWATGATADTITLDGTTTGGSIGDSIECIDIASGKWAVQVRITQSGTEATPFSATV